MNTQEIQHQKFLTKISRKPKCVNQFLTSNPNLLNTLNQHYQINRERKNIYTDKYKYDEKIKDQEELKTEILKFTIDLIYKDVDEIEKERFFKVSDHFINEKIITRPFKLISNLSFDSKLTSINTLYNYIVSKGRTQEPIFNEDIEEEPIEEPIIEEPIIEEPIEEPIIEEPIEEPIIEEPIIEEAIEEAIIEEDIKTRDCNICFEAYTDKTKFLCDNENCNNEICPCCFIRITRPRKCPFCRNDKLAFIGSLNYDNEESDDDNSSDSSDNSSDSGETVEPNIEYEEEPEIRRREIKFIYENQIRIKNIRYDYLDDNEIILLCPNYNTIEEATLRIDTFDYLRQNLIEEYLDMIENDTISVSTEFIYQNILSKYNDIIDYDIIDYMKQESKSMQIMHLLGWVNHPQSNENRKTAIDYLISEDGMESTFNFEFIALIEPEGNGADEGAGFYLYASSLSDRIFE